MAKAQWCGSYDAAQLLLDRCLRRDGSLFSESRDRPIWTADLAVELDGRVGSPDTSEASFQRRRRLAAVGGAAVAAKKYRDSKLASEQEQPDSEQPDSAPQDELRDPAAPAAPGGVTPETTQRLKELGELHEQGVPRDEEFAGEKAKVLET
jgi:hypothetical protein